MADGVNEGLYLLKTRRLGTYTQIVSTATTTQIHSHRKYGCCIVEVAFLPPFKMCGTCSLPRYSKFFLS